MPTPGAAEAAEASKEALFLLDTQNFGKALARLRFAFQATKPIRAFCGVGFVESNSGHTAQAEAI